MSAQIETHKREDELWSLAKDLDDMGFCSCANFESPYEALRDILTSFEPLDEPPDRSDIQERLGKTRDLGLYYLFLFLLEKAGLTEHGGNVNAGFLTDSGEQLLKLLKRYKPQEVEPYFDRL